MYSEHFRRKISPLVVKLEFWRCADSTGNCPPPTDAESVHVHTTEIYSADDEQKSGHMATFYFVILDFSELMFMAKDDHMARWRIRVKMVVLPVLRENHYADNFLYYVSDHL